MLGLETKKKNWSSSKICRFRKGKGGIKGDPKEDKVGVETKKGVVLAGARMEIGLVLRVH